MASSTRSRQCGPKVRSGCLVCKVRHLKCDETKPTCLRCERSNFTCEYRPQKPKNGRKQGRELKLLLPRGDHVVKERHDNITIPQPTTSVLSAGPLVSQPDMMEPLFPTPDQHRYFDFFWQTLDARLGRMAPYWNMDFWSRYIFRECFHGESVRQSAIGLGALTWPREGHQCGRPSLEGKSGQSALAHHIKAVSMLRKLCMGEDAMARPMTVLVLTLMISAFEMIQGNLAAGNNVLNGGVALLRQILEEQNSRGSFDESQATNKDHQGIEEHLMCCNMLKYNGDSTYAGICAGLIGLMDMGNYIRVE